MSQAVAGWNGRGLSTGWGSHAKSPPLASGYSHPATRDHFHIVSLNSMLSG